jgi:hypothetical protein
VWREESAALSLPWSEPQRLLHTHLSGNPGFRNAFLRRLTPCETAPPLFHTDSPKRPDGYCTIPQRRPTLRSRPQPYRRPALWPAAPLRHHRGIAHKAPHRAAFHAARQQSADTPPASLPPCRRLVAAHSASEVTGEASLRRLDSSSSLSRSPALNRRAASGGWRKGSSPSADRRARRTTMAMAAGGAKRPWKTPQAQAGAAIRWKPGADVVMGSERIWRQPGSDAPH